MRGRVERLNKWFQEILDSVFHSAVSKTLLINISILLPINEILLRFCNYSYVLILYKFIILLRESALWHTCSLTFYKNVPEQLVTFEFESSVAQICLKSNCCWFPRTFFSLDWTALTWNTFCGKWAWCSATGHFSTCSGTFSCRSSDSTTDFSFRFIYWILLFVRKGFEQSSPLLLITENRFVFNFCDSLVFVDF